MNKYLICLILCISTTTYQSQTFQHLYGGAGTDIFNDMQQLPDQGYLLCGTSSSHGEGGANMLVSRTDGLGSIIWSKVLGGDFNDYYAKLSYNTKNGSIYLVGTSDKETDQDIVISKMNLNGDILWNKQLKSKGNDIGTCISATSDGGFIFSGIIETYAEVSSSDILVFKGNSSGEVEWSVILGTEGHDKPMSVIETTDHQYILYAHSNHLFENGDYNTCLMKFAKNGDLVASNVLFAEKDQLAWTMFRDEYTGEIYLSGDTKLYDNNHINGTLTKIDNDLNIIYSKMIGSDEGNDHVLDIATDIEGNLFVSGCYGSHENIGGLDGFLISMSPDLELTAAKCFGGQDKDVAYAMELTPDLRIALAGYTRSFKENNVQGYFIKTDIQSDTECNQKNAHGYFEINDMNFEVSENSQFKETKLQLVWENLESKAENAELSMDTKCAAGNLNTFLSQKNILNEEIGGNNQNSPQSPNQSLENVDQYRISSSGQGKILIEVLKDSSPIRQVDVFDISGKLVLSTPVSNEQKKYEINLSSSFHAGSIYFVQLTSVNGKIFSEKILASF